jgi:hypothetical protein
MEKEFTLAISGDAIINRRLSVHTEERFLSLVKILRDADVAYTHFETITHDYEGDELYPAAEPGYTAMRSPRFVVDELKWMGFDLVSLAHNHCLDYSYGGLFSTWEALNEGNLPHAGTGKNLAEAREPAYLDTRKGRIALISMTSSFSRWSRAGEARRDVKGRPGVNPLRFYHVVDETTAETLKQLALKLGWAAQQDGKTLIFHQAGAENTFYKFVQGDPSGVTTVVEEEDAEGNLRSIREARRQADYVLVHLHTHEWDPEKGLSAPPKFNSPFAKACIDAGADAFITQGCHHPLRGIEMYRGKPIFYDLGDFIGMNSTVTRLPAETYASPRYTLEMPKWEATPADVFDAREKRTKPFSPAGGSFSGRIPRGAIVAVFSLGEGWSLLDLKLYPVTLVHKPRSKSGIPLLADEKTARLIIDYMEELSAPFGTKIEFRDGIGFVRL